MQLTMAASRLPTIAETRDHAHTLAAMASRILSGLAMGQYGPEVTLAGGILGELGIILPPVADVEMALRAFLFLNSLTAPRGKLVPDGAGGYVPESNSRYNPKTGEFL